MHNYSKYGRSNMKQEVGLLSMMLIDRLGINVTVHFSSVFEISLAYHVTIFLDPRNLVANRIYGQSKVHISKESLGKQFITACLFLWLWLLALSVLMTLSSHQVNC